MDPLLISRKATITARTPSTAIWATGLSFRAFLTAWPLPRAAPAEAAKNEGPNLPTPPGLRTLLRRWASTDGPNVAHRKSTPKPIVLAHNWSGYRTEFEPCVTIAVTRWLDMRTRKLENAADGRTPDRVRAAPRAAPIHPRRRSWIPSSRSCASSTGAGAPVSGSAPEAVFGKAITSRIESVPCSSRDDAVEAVGDAAVRRRAVAERLEQEAEARLGLLGADAERLEDGALDVRAVDADRAAAQLDARSRRRRRRSARAARDRSGSSSPAGEVNGWWSGSQRSSSSFHSNSGQSTTQRSA